MGKLTGAQFMAALHKMFGSNPAALAKLKPADDFLAANPNATVQQLVKLLIPTHHKLTPTDESNVGVAFGGGSFDWTQLLPIIQAIFAFLSSHQHPQPTP